jgi:hypothetical protein
MLCPSAPHSEQAALTVRTRDRFGNPSTHAVDYVTAALCRGDGGARENAHCHARTRSSDGGCFELVYRPVLAGSYTLVVCVSELGSVGKYSSGLRFGELWWPRLPAVLPPAAIISASPRNPSCNPRLAPPRTEPLLASIGCSGGGRSPRA